jgi:hypothetical protein
MTPSRYNITVGGLIGPTLKSAFSELDIEDIARHHVIVVASNAHDTLLSILSLLDGRGIEVDRVVARYR